MRLTHLELNGFKSFAQPVEISVERDGITAIVGPNGCGKSNISDAIRWVLGEQSARALRCAKMDDIVFNGGADHKPAKVAKVSLGVSNEEGLLALDTPTVTVSREVHREGDSKYFLNGAPCLLRDIHELFMDTGIGRNAYSLMEQGNIDLILNAKPEERRFLFDEVAGITKSKYRKKAALKKLEDTDQNLVRINDAIGELEIETENLRTQADKAFQFRDRQENLRVFEIELARRQWERIRGKLGSMSEELAGATSELQEFADGAEELEEAVTKGAERRTVLEAEIQGAQTQVFKIDTEIERTESTIALYQERLTNLSDQHENSSAQISALHEQAGRVQKQIDDRIREREQLQVDLQMDQGRLTGRQRVVHELTTQIDTAGQEIEDAKAALIELMNKDARSQNELSTLEQRAEHSGSQRTRLEGMFRKLQGDLGATRLDLDEARRRIKDFAAQLASGKTTLSEVSTTTERTQTALRKLEAEMRGHQDTLAMGMSRVQSLEDLQKTYEGYYMGVRAVLRVHEEDPERLPGICGVVAELIRTSPDYERAIEVALGSGIQNIVTETAEDAKTAIGFLKEHNAGRVTFLPLDILRSRDRRDDRVMRCAGVVGWAPDLVERDAQYKAVVESLLGNVVVVETLDDAIHIARRERPNMRLVTLEGEVLNPGGSMTGGGRDRSAGFLQRPREIEDLKEKIKRLSGTLAKKEEERKKGEEQLNGLQQQRVELQETIQRLEIEKSGAEKDLSQVQEKEKRLAEESQITESEIELLSEETGDISRETGEVKVQLDQIQKERQAKERSAHNLEEQRAATIAKRAEVEESVTEMKVELAGRREKIESMASAITALEESLEDARSRAKELEGAIANHETAVRSLEEKTEDAQRSFRLLEEKRFEHAEEVVRLEAEREDVLKEIADAEKEMRRSRRELEKLSKLRHNLDVELTQMRMEERQIADRVQEKYRVAIADVERSEELTGDEFEIVERVKELRAQIEAMGAVNLLAIEEYDGHRQRLEFLSGQRDDLEGARGSILKAVQKINDAARERFLDVFEKIQTNFEEVFVQLFGGGETELRLHEADDVLDAGIEIIARPPGKRPQSITMLSGGERSLIAIALLFAVFKIRPSPFCVLDEVDAALDEANVVRFAHLINDYSASTQFLIITHNKRTMEKADLLYGVTMEQAGVSKMVSVKLTEAVAAVSA